MRIDISAHILPEEYFARREQVIPGAGVPSARGIPCLFDLDVRFRIMDQFDGYKQVLSLASPPLEGFAPVNVTADLTRLGNDGLADLVRTYPDQFAGALGNLPLNDTGASVRELERLRGNPEFVGVQIHSNVCGRPLDSPGTLDVIEESLRHRWPYETTIAMARLAFAGLFDRHPARRSSRIIWGPWSPTSAIVSRRCAIYSPHTGRTEGLAALRTLPIGTSRDSTLTRL